MTVSRKQFLGVELARPGTWHLATGRRSFDEKHLKDAADFFKASGQNRIPLGLGHTDTRFDGDPAFGWVGNIRYTEDEKGPVLLGDLVDVAPWLAAAAQNHWPNRSIEGFADLDWNGRVYSLALTRLALLGATPPAMPTLADMQALVAASASPAITAAASRTGAEFIRSSHLPQRGENMNEDDPVGDALADGRLAPWEEGLARLLLDAEVDENDASPADTWVAAKLTELSTARATQLALVAMSSMSTTQPDDGAYDSLFGPPRHAPVTASAADSADAYLELYSPLRQPALVAAGAGRRGGDEHGGLSADEWSALFGPNH